MKAGKIFKATGKNMLVFLLGAVVGAAAAFLFFLPSALGEASEKAGLGIVALAPALSIIYGVVGIAVGGLGGVILYNIVKLVKRKKKQHKIETYGV